MEPNLPYPDAKVAAAICCGGPCKHVVKEGSGVNDMWMKEHASVVPYTIANEQIED